MSFQYDIYISYDAKDNQANEQGSQGWVTAFKRFMEEAVLHILGEAPAFLFYANNEKPSEEALAQTAVMLSVVSPHYVKSSDAIEDIESFAAQNPSNYQERLFKVVKFPVGLEDEPTKLKDLIPFKFFKKNNTTQEYEAFESYFDEEAEKYYWTQLIDLAYDVANTLRSIKNIKNDLFSRVEIQRQIIFLADVTPNLQSQRSIIKRELQRKGFIVLPNQALPANRVEAEIRIKKDLERSQLAIHLVSGSYGEPIDDEGVSMPHLQYKIAVEHSNLKEATKGSSYDNTQEFKRLVWIEPNIKYTSEEQQLFVESIRQNADSIEGAEILQAPLEDLKVAIKKIINDLDSRDEENLIGEIAGNNRSVYLIYDKIDKVKAEILAGILESKGFEVKHPIFEGNLLKIRKVHINHLVGADAALVYYGSVSPEWVKMKLLDLLKASGFGRKKNWVAKAVVAEQPLALADTAITNGVEVVENTVAFGAINNFLAKMS